MKFFQVLLLAVLLLSMRYNFFVSSAESSPRTNISAHHTDTRLLHDVGSSGSEERGFWTRMWTSLKMKWKTRGWADAGKSDEFVKKELGIEGRTVEAMKTSPNYKYYLKFLDKAEGVQVDNWVYSGKITPRTVWKHLKLDRMSKTQRENSDDLRLFERYFAKYDKKVYSDGFKAYHPETPEEKEIFVKIWAQADRPESHVKKMLNIDQGTSRYNYYFKRMEVKWKPEEEIMHSPAYGYLKLFRRLREQYN